MASTLTRAVLAEVEALKAENAELRGRIGPLERALAPAFTRQAPRHDPYVPQSWCGEGYCRPAAPCDRCAQAGPGQCSPRKTSDPWERDAEHSAAFMAQAADSTVPLSVLRQSAASDQAMAAAQAAERAAAPSVLWPSPAFCGQPGCRPATPCARCAGQVSLVKDKSGEVMGGRGQRTLVHISVPELGSERPGYVNPGIGGYS